MSLNWKEINCILEELQLPGSAIQKIIQPDYKNLVFQIYRPSERFYLRVSFEQGAVRLHRTAKRPRAMNTKQRFVQLLKSRIQGGKINDVEHVQNERIVKLSIRRGGETTLMWIRLWGNAGNIILTDEEGSILDAMYRRPKRGEVSGANYSPTHDLGGTKGGKTKEFQIRSHPADTTFNEFIDDLYSARRESAELEDALTRLRKEYRERESAIQTNLERLRRKIADFQSSRRLQEIGDTILANIDDIPAGEEWLTAKNVHNPHEDLHIQLDPRLSHAENAERYYERYKKNKSGLTAVETERDRMEHELGRLGEEYQELITSRDLRRIRRFLRDEKTQTARTGKSGDGPPGLRFNSNGFTILVGRDARVNDELLRRHVRGNDYWLHTRDYPGAYVFIKHQPGKSVPLTTLLDAGNLALFYSKGRNSAKGDLYYTQVKYLRRAKNGKLGLVLPTQEKNLCVELDSQRLERLKMSGNGKA